ncbi:MAG TPA: hypothetical protein VNW53_00185 [Phenylobacterium sp.]|jgi:hypothetical protein|uniref:hypothetical protein n=1 Tax=Phenylobacterium sp. TaxID=1871053 RepID=UPI002C42C23B|nr:hypothetical protein [Phenylobacterium sp.]HXA37391.1 hypothetical protein [Phenylobacterium sp.]
MSIPFRRPAFGVAVVLLSALSGAAFADPAGDTGSAIAAAFGNTVTTTYPDGRSQQIWLQPGGLWTGLGRTHAPFAGTWDLKGQKICLKQKKPPTLGLSYCAPFPANARVGDGWPSKDFFGTPIQVRLVAGQGDRVRQATAAQ